MQTSKSPDWHRIVLTLRSYAETAPSVSLIAEEEPDPYRILIATIISLRTKDEVTLRAARRLFCLADNPRDMSALLPSEIEAAIFPAGFYRKKALTIERISRALVEQHGGRTPSDEEALLALPGVGRKTANLVRGLGFNIPAICVDTHVHRIANRMGWILTTHPHETEEELQNILPKEYWIEINALLVNFGQQICRPLSPLCGSCSFKDSCPKRLVKTHR